MLGNSLRHLRDGALASLASFPLLVSLGYLKEPGRGIEPLTYSLRVNRSAD
jgi:hypothetical protein